MRRGSTCSRSSIGPRPAATTACRSTSTAPATASCRARRPAHLRASGPAWTGSAWLRPRDERHRRARTSRRSSASAACSARAACARTCGTRAPSTRRSRRPIADLRAIAPVCAAHGVDVLLENHEDFTGAELATILDAVGHPAVGALFDYGNSMMVGEEPAVALDAILPHARSAHLQGPRLRRRAGRRAWVLGVPIGSGALPIADLTRRLAAPAARSWSCRASGRTGRQCARGVAAPSRGRASSASSKPPFDPLLRPWDADACRTRLVELEAEALEAGRGLVARPDGVRLGSEEFEDDGRSESQVGSDDGGVLSRECRAQVAGLGRVRAASYSVSRSSAAMRAASRSTIQSGRTTSEPRATRHTPPRRGRSACLRG